MTEFDLLCDKEYLVSILESMLYIGVTVWALIFPQIAEMYGRKLGQISAYLTGIIGIILTTFGTNLWMIGAGLLFSGGGIT